MKAYTKTSSHRQSKAMLKHWTPDFKTLVLKCSHCHINYGKWLSWFGEPGGWGWIPRTLFCALKRVLLFLLLLLKKEKSLVKRCADRNQEL